MARRLWIAKRSDNQGTYYSFSYEDETGKRKRIPKSKYPRITTEQEARDYANSMEGYEQSQKESIKAKTAWKDKYHVHSLLLNKFIEHHKEEAKNSWYRTKISLTFHVFHYFLDVAQANNANFWYRKFPEFRTWLKNEARTNIGKPLATATANKAIHALNNYLSFLGTIGEIDYDISQRKCKSFQEHNEKNYTHVIQEREFSIIYEKLGEINQDVADFWYVLYFTGLRFNELHCLPMSFIRKGQAPDSMHEELKRYNYTKDYFGFIRLESQGLTRGGKGLKRDEFGVVSRKPLKGRKTISAKNTRIIPIVDKECWNILATRYKAQLKLKESRIYGSEQINYLLFGEAINSSASRWLAEVYLTTSFKAKTWHDLRHTFCTNFCGKTKNFYLTRAILGHSEKVFERYLHIYERIAEDAKLADNVIDIVP